MRTRIITLSMLLLFIALGYLGMRPAAPATALQATVVTTGVAQETGMCSVTVTCRGGGNNREALCGEITATDGSVWEVPSPVSDGEILVDVFNDCTGTGENPGFESQLVTQVIDPDGEEITAYLFGDNYFEFYANGTYVGRDAVGFTPFNSHAARFQVSYPVTYAVLLVDWEGFLGIGLEDRQGGFHIGDGGFVAAFSDGVVTDEEWDCRPFYIAPLDDVACIELDEEGNPDSSGCPSSDQAVACLSNDPTRTCQGAHYELPNEWMQPDFDDSGWPAAATYSANQVTNSSAYRDYEDTLFRNADFIWSSNLDLDNQVVCRTTVEAP